MSSTGFLLGLEEQQACRSKFQLIRWLSSRMFCLTQHADVILLITRVMNGMRHRDVDALLSIAVDLTASLASQDRLVRLVEAVRRAIPCDAAAVLELVQGDLIPLATHGLAPEVLGRRFARREHPRLEVVVARKSPVRFPADSELPDPYDGLLLDNPDATRDVHACLGLPLMEGDAVIG